MGPTGLPLLVITLIVSVLAPVGTVVLWDRGRRLRVARRAGMLILCELLTLATAGVAINRSQDFFTTWPDLLGTGYGKVVAGDRAARLAGVQPGLDRPAQAADTGLIPYPAPAHPAPGSSEITPARLARLHAGHKGSQVITFTSGGPFTGYRLPMAVYLPAAYFEPAYRPDRFPVVEFLDGYPASLASWLHGLELKHFLDRAIARHEMPPAIGVVPTTDPTPPQDSECVNAARGAQAATYLTADVPSVIERDFRAAVSRDAWALAGYSTGGFCAVNLILQHPAQYGAAISLSGYFTPITDPTTGNLYAGNAKDRAQNNPAWEITHRQLLPISLFLAAGRGDREAMTALHRFAPRLPKPITASIAILPHGGHNETVWRKLLPPAFSWLGFHLSRPSRHP